MWTTKHFVTLGVASAASLGAGFALGSYLARRKAGVEFDKRLEKESEEIRRFFLNIHKDVDPETLAAEIDFNEVGYQKYNTQSTEIPQDVLDKIREAEEELEEESEPIDVFATPDPAAGWNQDAEEESRRNGVPFVISHDEFYNNEWDFEEGNLVWYEGDGTLTDSRDEPILEEVKYLGDDFEKKFGHGSNDPNIVYICNEQMEMIFEVCRSNRSFAEDVLGFVPDNSKELKHSARQRRRRDE
jgi:hypothetical protein